MMGIIGKKIGMTRLIKENGLVVPITIIECVPNKITQIKTKEKDGYSAIVLGFEELKKPTKTKKFKKIREFQIDDSQEENYKQGDTITVESLKETTTVKVTGTSKGKGFQGVIKRYNFSRGPESHGSGHHREPGSIGACAKPGRVHKGKKLPGRMGAARKTIDKVKIEHIDTQKNIICLKGAIPGPPGGIILIKSA